MQALLYFLFFFFSSRRRHTRWNCDWSSDVCSSDLFSWPHSSAGKSPFEHRRMGPRKTNIKSGAYFTWVNDRFVLSVPLYNPNNSVPRRHFFLFDMSSNTSAGGSSTHLYAGEIWQVPDLLGQGGVCPLYNLLKLLGFVVSAMRPTLPPGQAARRGQPAGERS